MEVKFQEKNNRKEIVELYFYRDHERNVHRQFINPKIDNKLCRNVLVSPKTIVVRKTSLVIQRAS